jgi:hypothetical protein
MQTCPKSKNFLVKVYSVGDDKVISVALNIYGESRWLPISLKVPGETPDTCLFRDKNKANNQEEEMDNRNIRRGY